MLGHFVGSSIQSSYKDLLSTYYVLSTDRGARKIEVNTTEKDPSPEFTDSWRQAAEETGVGQ